MKKLLIMFAVMMAIPSMALALPGSSVYPNAKRGNEFGPVKCGACHKSNPQFEDNVYVDVRDENGNSLVSDGVAEVPWMPGKSTSIQVVVGLKKQDKAARLAGWFVNLPAGTSLKNGSVNYCYQQINYGVKSEFSADGKPFRTFDTHSITFHRYMKPQETELWVGVGSKGTDTPAGSPARKATLGLKTLKIRWIKLSM